MEMFSFLKKLSWRWNQAGVYCLYLVSHLLLLTAMPVFADEAIYIRWAQLIIDDWQRYSLFSLNDGKTPIFIWVMVPFLKFVTNQLLAGRLLAVVVGLFQVFLIKELVKVFGGKRKAQLISMVLTVILPFWFFYHRIALMDGLMTLFISYVVLTLVKLAKHLEKEKTAFAFNRYTIFFTVGAGVSFGLAILSKLPGLFLSPVFVLIAAFPFTTNHLRLSITKFFWIGLAGVIGISLFLLLKLHPAFAQLFLRGGNFTYSIGELLAGDWVNSIRNIPRFSGWLIFYLSPTVILFPLAGLLDKKIAKKVGFLILSAALFCGPFVVFGKTVYPRYLLPSAIFLTVATGLVSENWLEKRQKIQLITLGLLGLTFLWSMYNIVITFVNINDVPFVALDREQYQTEWSAGYGVRESVDFIQEQAKQGKVVVATEGYFGTLPDGILLYLHNQDVANIEVFGIGEPIRSVPSEFVMKATNAHSAYIMVNSHRMMTNDPRLTKVKSFPRPYNAPSFDIYEFKQ
ncbi:MAG: glycosyltransferase family 39 protein [Patescibacteria group bacterium]